MWLADLLRRLRLLPSGGRPPRREPDELERERRRAERHAADLAMLEAEVRGRLRGPRR